MTFNNNTGDIMIKKIILFLSISIVIGASIFCGQLYAQEKIIPIAILPFEERGIGLKDQGRNVHDLLFVNLSQNSKIFLIERAEIDKLLKEAELNLTGLVAKQQVNQIGKLTGAKIIIKGSIFNISDKTYIVVKIIGTETGKVIGKSVNGTESLDILIGQLVKQIEATIVSDAAALLPEEIDTESRLAIIRNEIKGKNLPSAYIDISEIHVARQVIDPAAETEMIYIYKELGGIVIDAEEEKTSAEYKIIGEGFSEFGTRIGNLVSVKARVEIKVIDKNGRVMAIDRQSVVKIDLNELLAGKSALQEATSLIAERIIPKLAK